MTDVLDRSRAGGLSEVRGDLLAGYQISHPPAVNVALPATWHAIDRVGGGTWVSDDPVPPPSGGLMPIPDGYSATNRLFIDDFGSLNTQLWSQYPAKWQYAYTDLGKLLPPLGGPNEGSFWVGYWDPACLAFGPNGYVNSMVPVSNPPPRTGYVSKAGYLTTYGAGSNLGLVKLGPTGYLFIEILCQLGSTPGFWPSFWMTGQQSVPSTNGDNDELDIFEGGYTGIASNIANALSSHYHATANQSQGSIDAAKVLPSGSTMGNSFNRIAVEIIAGKSITTYVGPGASGPLTPIANLGKPALPTQTWCINLEVEVAGQQASGWHSVYAGGTDTYCVKEIQAFSR